MTSVEAAINRSIGKNAALKILEKHPPTEVFSVKLKLESCQLY